MSYAMRLGAKAAKPVDSARLDDAIDAVKDNEFTTEDADIINDLAKHVSSLDPGKFNEIDSDDLDTLIDLAERTPQAFDGAVMQKLKQTAKEAAGKDLKIDAEAYARDGGTHGDWDEGKHPRDDAGKFTNKSGFAWRFG